MIIPAAASVSATPADMIDPAATITTAPADGAPVEVTATGGFFSFRNATDDEKRAAWSDVALFASLLSAAITLFGNRR